MEHFQQRLNKEMTEHKIGVQALALALKDSIDPGVFTIEDWLGGKVTPSEEKQTIVLQALGNIIQNS
jgi:hypothetical protein